MPSSEYEEGIPMTLNGSNIRIIKCSYNRFEMLVNIYRINFIDKEKRKIRVHMNAGIFNYNGTLKELQERLPDNFIKIDKSIIFNVKRTYATVCDDEILYVERLENSLIIHTRENTYLHRGTLKKYESEVGDNFFRIHNGYLINLKHIVCVSHKTVKMSNGDELPVATAKRKDFIRKLEKFML